MSERGGLGARGGPSFGERRLAEETRERFMREIVARVPLERIAAVHLFRPIRQGGFESGIAVVTAELPAPEVLEVLEVPAMPEAPEAPAAEGDAAVEAAVVAEPVAEADAAPGAETIDEPAADPTEAAAGPAPDGAGEGEPSAGPEAAVEATPDETVDARGEAEPPAEAEGELSEAAIPDAEPPEGELPEAEESEAELPEARPLRHTVFTARYRLAIKGPDRGRWDVDVVEEADAPMVTVEAVVRGVQRRAGDEGDPERLDAAAVARLVGAAPP